MKNSTFIAIFSLLTLLCGCASENAKYIESGGARSIISTNKINMADWNNAASSLLNDLVSSGALEKTGLKQPIDILVSRVVNRTSTAIDTDLLTTQICIALNNSGKATAVSPDLYTGKAEAERVGVKVPNPQLTISGKIIEGRESNSSLKEVTYVFFLQVNYAGRAIWIGQKQIAKQSEKGWF